MHYYGVYALARAAGLAVVTAQRIADASQFVDDYTQKANVRTDEGTFATYLPSGHGICYNDNFDTKKMENADPHRVWVPFHFLPGNSGDDYNARMKCAKGGNVTLRALEGILARNDEDFAPELIGIMAHIFADTYSHYGFSGLRSTANSPDVNNIDLDVRDDYLMNYLWSKAKGFLANLAAAPAGNMGHVLVADFPDLPYLRWRIQQEDGSLEFRDNQADYMEACEGLFKFFSDFRTLAPQYGEENCENSFDDIRPVITDIIAFEGKTEERISAWQVAATTGELRFFGKIPPYRHGTLDKELASISTKSMEDIKTERVWLFTSAVEVVRSTILNELLPNYGLSLG